MREEAKKNTDRDGKTRHQGKGKNVEGRVGPLVAGRL
jgi:hypothetical protein